MHLRNATATTTTATTTRNQRNGELQQQGKKAHSVGSGTTVRGSPKRKKKFIIWSLVLLQVFFVGCFWLFQLESIIHIDDVQSGERMKIEFNTDRINFIQKSITLGTETTKENSEAVTIKIAEQFTKDFVFNNNNRLRNETGTDDGEENDDDALLWCFREGTLNETRNREDELVQEEWYDENICRCQVDWHGKDCGQPEVIWRTLLTSKLPIKLNHPLKQEPHKLVYLVNGNFFNLDLLELQIRSVSEVVDYFIINVSNTKAQVNEIKAIEKKLRDILSKGRYLINYFVHNNKPSRRSKKLQTKKSYTSAQAYRLFKHEIAKQRTWKLKPSDIFLYTNDQEILNGKALKFIKYYLNTDVGLTAMKFRFKYVVYGFYWQHPQLTHIDGFLSTIATLDNSTVANGDPQALLEKITTNAVPSIVIGDLNHYGGWFCKYCQHPDQIIEELHAEQNSTGHIQFPNATRNRQIDATYMRTLIAQGRYIDNKVELLKLRRYSDKYYAPGYAENCTWKFGNLLVNLYMSLEEDIDDDDGVY